ncbi:hypothetical protein AB0F49_28060 [Micromonospora ureilytica]|uniref:hypothetical protein n=1 Tax=Micromonospora ureilytica TaxID=709868 RepID=UPI0034076726
MIELGPKGYVLTGMTSTTATSLARATAPRMFGSDGLVRAADGTMSYRDQPENLVRMLSNAVAGNGRREAVAEVGGPRLTYDVPAGRCSSCWPSTSPPFWTSSSGSGSSR